MQSLKNKLSPIITTDPIYGKVKITSPLILELLNSKDIIRLKKISQFGVPDKYYHLKKFSRYQHSLGVYILLNKLGASEIEQAAGLLHDISHTAFSHVYDWIKGNKAEEHSQDETHKTFLPKSDVGKILKKHLINPVKISKLTSFKLLETEIPNLCADRIDYALREFPLVIARKCFNNLCVKNKKIVFKNEEIALIFAKNFLLKQDLHWGGFEAVARYAIFGKVLKIALEKNIIRQSDFWEKEEAIIIKKLIDSKNSKIKQYLNILTKKSLKNLKRGKEIRYKKFRYVDPLFLKNGKILRLSLNNLKFKHLLKETKQENLKGVFIPILTE
ncbi:HD domain-containing protein [Patescibacteria group bacterium]|nr:HD domain-containing protein [Patescibacteria group bacterium]